MPASIHDMIKNNSSSIAAIFSTIALIGGSVIYVETNFASAKDIKDITETQQRALKVQSTTQRQFNIFQLEYYDDKLKKLQDEKRIAADREKSNIKTPSRNIQRSTEEIQEDIDDIKKRREFVRKTLEE